MPRFFFDIHDGAISLDEVGTEFMTLDAAAAEATNALCAIAVDKTRVGGVCPQLCVTVRGDHGRPVFAAALDIRTTRF